MPLTSFTLITGNSHKLQEWQRLLPSDIVLQHQSVDLVEIQSLDNQEIIAHKLHEAYAHIKSPVVVEDVSAGLAQLGGLPGPFIKFFEQQLGPAALFILAGSVEASASVSCTVGYFDGVHELIVSGNVGGNVVAPRGDNGFGFDSVFMPDGSTSTFAQMEPPEKDALSHRYLAISQLLTQLQKL